MKHTKKSGILAVVLYLTMAFFLNAKEFFVTTPAEISAAMQQAEPGDSLKMKDGEWRDVKIVFSGNGAEDNPIVLTTGTPGMVRIRGKSYLRISGSYLVVDGLYFEEGYSPSGAIVEFRSSSSNLASHCRLTSCAIVDFNPPSSSTDYKWISLYGQYNRVDNCYIRGKNHTGTTLVVWMDAIPDYHLIDHNYFAERPELGVNGGETIRIGTSDWSMYNSFTTVEYNYFEKCDGEIEIISNKSCENTYRYNTFFNSKGTLTLRHGNRCYVYGNFFFGENNSRMGGVRIIGEDHIVYNNYFQDLQGTGFRAALPLVNGVPNSPLNRYYQVKNAKVLFNTFVDCYENIVIGAGADDELSLPPKDCLIANNIIKTKFSNEMVTVEAEPINLTWMANIFDGSKLGIDLPAGISLEDPLLTLSPDNLWRLSENSPAINVAEGDFSYVLDDMDGQARTNSLDIGADEYSVENPVRTPITGADVGPAWFPPPPLPDKIRYVNSGFDSLRLAVESADDDEMIVLISTGIYDNSETIIIDKPVTINVSENLLARPVIRNTATNDTAKAIFEIREGGVLRIAGLDLDGLQGSDDPCRELIRSGKEVMAKDYSLFANNCIFRDAGLSDEGYLFRGFTGTFADTIKFENSLFTNSTVNGITFDPEAEGSGKYTIKEFQVLNCTFWDIPGEVIKIYAGDNIPFTLGPVITIDHVTFDHCGGEGQAVIDANECDFTTIRNSIFSNSNGSVAYLYGLAASIDYSNFYNIESVQSERSAKIGSHIFATDPGYADPQNGDFNLPENSILIEQGEDGKTLGDLRWAEGLTPIFTDEDGSTNLLPFALLTNYPNPFNNSTTIRYTVARQSNIKINIYNTYGQLVREFTPGLVQAGQYELIWDAQNLSSGIYYSSIVTNGLRQTRKMILVK